MKNVLLKTSIAVILLLAAQLPVSAAGGNDKLIAKVRETVANAAPDDWETLAKAAHQCIKKKVNLAEAKDWLDKSLQIKRSAYGLEIAGDYYLSNKLYDEAVNHYIESISVLKKQDITAETGWLQEKINEALAKA